MEEKAQVISIIGRYKIDGEVKNSIKKWRSQRTYMYDPWIKGRWCWREGGAGGGGRGEKCNCNSIINKIYIKIK